METTPAPNLREEEVLPFLPDCFTACFNDHSLSFEGLPIKMIRWGLDDEDDDDDDDEEANNFGQTASK